MSFQDDINAAITREVEVHGKLKVTEDEREALQQKVDAALAERDQATLTHDYQQDQINFWQEKAKQSAAENARMLSDYRDIPEMKRIGAPLTPATDAILNAVRAEGVEMFAKYCWAREHTRSDRRWVGAARNAELFANQLRAGNTEGATHD